MGLIFKQEVTFCSLISLPGVTGVLGVGGDLLWPPAATERIVPVIVGLAGVDGGLISDAGLAGAKSVDVVDLVICSCVDDEDNGGRLVKRHSSPS